MSRELKLRRLGAFSLFRGICAVSSKVSLGEWFEKTGSCAGLVVARGDVICYWQRIFNVWSEKVVTTHVSCLANLGAGGGYVPLVPFGARLERFWVKGNLRVGA